MEDHLIDEDLKKEIRYKVLLIRHNEDDPLTEAYLLEDLHNLYKKNNVKMSDKMKHYVRKEAAKIKESLENEYKKKKARYDKMLADIDEKKKKEEGKSDGIFSGSEFG